MTERGRVRFGNTDIDYTVRRSPRRHKTIQISVVGGEVVVAAPMRTSEDELHEIVRKRAPWIMRHASEEANRPAPKRFVSGETLPYLGRSVVMVIESTDDSKATVRFDHWRFRIAVPETIEKDHRLEAIREATIRWYRARAAERLSELVQSWWPRLGKGNPSDVLIRDQRQRWGSCAPDGTLRFNWRAMMLKPALIEYVVAHELAHLTHQNHAKEFWNLLASVMPDAQQRRRDLREAGRVLPL